MNEYSYLKAIIDCLNNPFNWDNVIDRGYTNHVLIQPYNFDYIIQ